MKLLIVSDIHGSAKYCKLLLQAAEREGADKLVLLGDILYHGPRNPLPEEYSPQEVTKMLSEVKHKIICVRGNCDAEIDGVLLPFPSQSDYSAVFIDGLNIYLSHGHRAVPPLANGDIYLTGHTHVPLNTVAEGYYHLNPGSVSLPKEDSRHGYILYENRKFTFKSLDGETYDALEIAGVGASVGAGVDTDANAGADTDTSVDTDTDTAIDESENTGADVGATTGATADTGATTGAAARSVPVVRKNPFARKKKIRKRR